MGAVVLEWPSEVVLRYADVLIRENQSPGSRFAMPEPPVGLGQSGAELRVGTEHEQETAIANSTVLARVGQIHRSGG